jgi:hypothetical protein
MKKLVWLLLVGLVGCKLDGTGTGNPMDSAVDDMYYSSVGYIVVDVCDVVYKCHGSDAYKRCWNEIWALTSYSARLGVVEESPSTIRSLFYAEIGGDFVSNPNVEVACRQEIRNFTCDSPEAVNSYVSGSTDPFAGTVELLTPICSGLLTKVEPDP